MLLNVKLSARSVAASLRSAYTDIVQRTTLMLRRFFRRQKPPAFQGIYIDGNLYSRSGSDVAVRKGMAGGIEVCQPDHVAPNGVSVQQIAYALAMIEGAIAISSVPQFSRQSSGIGLN
jgi:hypothetical protein